MFFKNISIIYRHSAILFQKRLSGLRLNNTEQSILLYLKRKDGVNQHAIVRFFQFNKATVAKTLSVLEEMGFIKRETSCESKREKCVYLTEAGTRAAVAIKESRRQLEEEVMAEFTEEERALFAELSERIAVKVWKLNQESEG
ncbi:MarR family transcriptional regulator [Eubacterium sp. 1001713B170207_170306_E7]|uniref:MarR family winged helix-turn-helix transcriptional regulator n=1 Tax=Eubacterium sp. 1001713B170207_170306_E7 TaxID=2787097 RepID=UPI00189A46BC|nr:MarR family transcriptional regulator [Eubacterium sp. 1001713B170207_170306_E7]